MATKPTVTIDCAENYDRNDEFHKQLESLNRTYGAGTVIAIVWSVRNMRGKRHGMVVCQFPNGLNSRRFSVDVGDDAYTLKFLNKIRHVKSDYFSEVTA